MPTVHPFRAIQYATGHDLSALVAPPYDVLDTAGKGRLLAKDPRNIVAIDLPHTPAKELGPSTAYEGAASLLSKHLANGVLRRADQPLMFAYRQTFKSADGSRTVQRSGMACAVEAVPFGPRPGGGMLPHEETFSGPKEDRMALMKATRTQLSPIFGLHADDSGRATALLQKVMASRGPDTIARTDDGTLHEVWNVADAGTTKAYQDALAGEDVFIADGHHRYTTGLNYLKSLEAAGPIGADHPARRCMIVLVGMSDPGLVIWPTHRVLGGMTNYTLDGLLAAAKPHFTLRPATGDLAAVNAALDAATDLGASRFALWDFTSRRGFLASPAAPDPLASRFPDKPRAWRDLTVAIIQYVLVEQVCQAALNAGNPVKWAFPHTIPEVEEIGSGRETGAGGGTNFAQVAAIVRPTPLAAVRDVSRANQLMPQKSTFFYPKLATGLFMNPLA
ncbi:MAG: phosphatase [Phycisphaerae bacterium]|nr:MAG: phosphatase [Phycisphaerae bacterium]